MTWRVGNKLRRTLYRDDVCVGMVDTPELASAIVEAMNAAQPATAPTRTEAEQAVLDAMTFIAIDSVHHLANDHDNPGVRTAFRAELARRGLKP